MVALFYPSFTLCLTPSKMTTGKGEGGRRERGKNCLQVALSSWLQRPPNAWSVQLLSWLAWAVGTQGWPSLLLSAPSWRLCCICKLEVPCSPVPVLVFKDEGFDFQEGRRWKERKEGVGGLCRPTAGGQRPSTYNNFKWGNYENKILHSLSLLLKTYDTYCIHHPEQRQVLASQNSN